ncbi:hypothetical protein WA026_005741 [Henosepilachna vigintioctopunctata]|uniref:Ferritin n=1 Tax=Henosepilachna vigintioctopunctata TaxID=420089 RepID=A0AAW1U302_9CUCU
MNSFILFAVCLLGITYQVNCQDCLSGIQNACRPNINKQSVSALVPTCDARYGAIDHLEHELVSYAGSHIIKSFEYLLLSTHFANYDMNRPGFHKLFRDYSDSKWSDGIELIKHITKRGGKMNFQPAQSSSPEDRNGYQLHEIQSLAKALDLEKSLMTDAFKIHERAVRRTDSSHDPEISHYIEEEFVEKQADNIRKLSGHITELSQMLAESDDNALSLYLFDDYLKGL